jgi:hypothetical protein
MMTHACLALALLAAGQVWCPAALLAAASPLVSLWKAMRHVHACTKSVPWHGPAHHSTALCDMAAAPTCAAPPCCAGPKVVRPMSCSRCLLASRQLLVLMRRGALTPAASSPLMIACAICGAAKQR